MTRLCLWAPHLPVQVTLADRPFVIVRQPWDDDQVLDGNALARTVSIWVRRLRGLTFIVPPIPRHDTISIQCRKSMQGL